MSGHVSAAVALVAGSAAVAVVAAFLRLHGRAARCKAAWEEVAELLDRRRRLVAELTRALSVLHLDAEVTLSRMREASREAERFTTPASLSRAERVVQSCLLTLFDILDGVDGAVWAGAGGLRESIERLESDIQRARLRYNTAVRAYNGELATVHGRLAGWLARLRPMEYFELRPPGI